MGDTCLSVELPVLMMARSAESTRDGGTSSACPRRSEPGNCRMLLRGRTRRPPDFCFGEVSTSSSGKWKEEITKEPCFESTVFSWLKLASIKSDDLTLPAPLLWELEASRWQSDGPRFFRRPVIDGCLWPTEWRFKKQRVEVTRSWDGSWDELPCRARSSLRSAAISSSQASRVARSCLSSSEKSFGTVRGPGFLAASSAAFNLGRNPSNSLVRSFTSASNSAFIVPSASFDRWLTSSSPLRASTSFVLGSSALTSSLRLRTLPCSWMSSLLNVPIWSSR
mmetsp:Transcript_159645/g.512288  ORF Transcript_159645/g.512288 Transcript_159645/m.512288 type:complete len:280 (+) Transcript_159645:477-1316(+)